MTESVSLSQLNAMQAREFVRVLGGIYEHSAWVAEVVEKKRPFNHVAELQQAMHDVVEQSSDTEQLALLKAHPEFAGKAAVSGELTEASEREQGSLSLQRLPAPQHQRMQQLNQAFMAKFGFPGIVAVRKQTSVEGIFGLLEKRLLNDIETERSDAMEQVHLIAECRLQDLVQ
jgi:2-oxo-4-hydroxy-4-carboxy-5-ureidoimidazoline decarboxylase